MSPTQLTRTGIIALIVAWCFDHLFWMKAPGISFFLFVLLCLGAGAYLTWGERQRPPWTSLAILLPALFFAATTFLRQEPFTQFISYLLTLACLAVLAMSWLGGQWWRYNLTGYLVNAFFLGTGMLNRPFRAYLDNREKQETVLAPTGDAPASTRQGMAAAPGQKTTRPVYSVLLGLLLALPVVAVLAALLAQADPVFSNRLEIVLKFLSIEKIGEYIFRLVYILIGAYLLVGVFLYALFSSRKEKLTGQEKPWMPAFLGWLEAAIVLLSVDVLFAFFVGIQFRYFFGGQSNINVEGFTYAEYARRGFGELVAVAAISLLLFLSLSSLTRREQTRDRRVFSILGIGLVALVAVILVSALDRLILYEAAYGFSRFRTYTHVFLIWLGILLFITVALELLGRMRGFALAAALVCVGFGLSLNLVNVDAWIVRQNVARAQQGFELDTAYLATLSDDAVPALFEQFHSSGIPIKIHNQIGSVLACRAAVDRQTRQSLSWPSFTLPRYQAERLYASYQAELTAFPVKKGTRGWIVTVNGAEQDCWAYRALVD
ncbi:MAG: DUF4153 domain-containing protein [Omnitrophica WOR_2 bacterium]